MLALAWDFFLSFSIRATFTVALVGGVDWLAWTYHAWRTRFWDAEDTHSCQLSFLLAGVTALVGLLGTFRRGRAEANFSVVALGGIVFGAATTQHPMHIAGLSGGRVLRRFPSAESFILGSALIGLWAFVALTKAELWPLRYGAIIGATQIVCGLALERFGGARAKVGSADAKR